MVSNIYQTNKNDCSRTWLVRFRFQINIQAMWWWFTQTVSSIPHSYKNGFGITYVSTGFSLFLVCYMFIKYKPVWQNRFGMLSYRTAHTAGNRSSRSSKPSYVYYCSNDLMFVTILTYKINIKKQTLKQWEYTQIINLYSLKKNNL